jgi:hypothetical protein
VFAFGRYGRFSFGGTMAGAPPYHTQAEIDDVVKRFEDCSYTPSEFVHSRHITVAAVYLVRFKKEVARERMRVGLRKFIEHHGKTGYHVTITEFWLALINREVMVSKKSDESVVSIGKKFVERCHDKDLIHQYYSRDLLSSSEAKAARLEPDLKPMPSEN